MGKSILGKGVNMPLEASKFIEQNPFGEFWSRLPQAANLRNFFSGRYNELYGKYLGELNVEARKTGRLPTLGFGEFLHKYPFKDEYSGYSPRQRGERPSLYSPRARFLNY